MKHGKLTLLSLFGVMVLAACGSSVVPSSSSSVGTSTPPSTSTPPTSDSSSIVDPNAPKPWANGAFNYSAASYAEKEEILSQLEGYVLNNFLAGIPLADNGGNVLYNHRLSIPSDVFIPNYGFGVSEGRILGPMTAAQEPETKYQWYYHTWLNSDPGTINYWNAQISTVADLHGLVNSAYYSTRLNAAKDNYEWYSQLATELPIPLNANEHGMATQWRVKVRTDAALTYRTLSTVPAISAFNNRQVVLADYLTPFKAMLDNNFFRATDLASATSGFKGVADYRDQLNRGLNPSWDVVTGIQLNVAENAIDFDFNTPKSSFYAMYNLSTSLFSPVPASFVSTVGAANYGKPDVNSMLSLGMYMLEEWQTGKQLAFKKNDTYFLKDQANFAGYKYAIITGATATTVAFNEFLDGKLDAVNIPSARIQEFKSDPRRRQTYGATVWRLNVNATTEERWEQLFGVNGENNQHSLANYWNVKPIMSNKNFLNGLYFAVNRQDYADKTGRNASHGVLSNFYMIDPENAISYRASDGGKAVLADRLPETFGFDQELAIQYFQAAIAELEAAGKYVPGTPANKTVIQLEMKMLAMSQLATDAVYLKNYIETTFNLANPNYQLVLNATSSADANDIYDAMEFGEFDLAFGSISGSALDPLSFMEVFTSDNRTGFTLSHGADTSVPTQEIRYDGLAWSYNALFAAAISGAIVVDGVDSPVITISPAAVTDPVPGDNLYTVTVNGTWYHLAPDDVEINFVAIGLYNANTGATVYYEIDDVLVINPDGTFVITFADVDLTTASAGYYVDIYYTAKIAGIDTPLINIYTYVPPRTAV